MRNGLKVVLCFGRVHKVFFPFFNKISCKLYFQESLTKGSDTFCLAITCCCSILKILQKHPKKSLANYSFASISLATLAHIYHQIWKEIQQDILQTTVWRELHNGLNILGYSRHCLASNIAISPLSRAPASPRAALDIYNFNIQPHQRSSTLSSRFWWGSFWKSCRRFQPIFQLLWSISDWGAAGTSILKLFVN